MTRPWAAVWSSPLGRIALGVEAQALARIERLAPGPDEPPSEPVAADALAQLRAWFDDPTQSFDVALAPAPTRFQARLRAALRALEPGEIITYGALARELGSSARAVGAACGANPLPIVVPCHRVVGVTGLGGYGGASTDAAALAFKRGLIDLERGTGLGSQDAGYRC